MVKKVDSIIRIVISKERSILSLVGQQQYLIVVRFFVSNSGFIAAASTSPEVKYGFVFLHCKITGDVPENSYYLGRPWRPYAKTVYLNCFLDKHIKPEGWQNWDNPENEKTAFYAEYKNYGPGADTTKRVLLVTSVN